MRWPALTLIARALCLAVTWVSLSNAQSVPDPCSDSLDPLLGCLSQWVGGESRFDYGYTAVASGAALAVAFQPAVGFHLPVRQRLVWPGNFLKTADSTFIPEHPESFVAATAKLLEVAKSGREALVITPLPARIYGVDTSFGEPWFFVVQCQSGTSDSSLWDAGDLKSLWWYWDDDPGANLIWTRPENIRAEGGRTAILTGLRHCVLSARPLTVGSTRTGLAAFGAGPQLQTPGTPAELARIARVRQAASDYLSSELDLWPKGEREPLKLVTYYLQRSAAAWTELSKRTSDWPMLTIERKEELLSTLQASETAAAVALDSIVSVRP